MPLDALRTDLRHAVRQALAAPAHTALTVAALALGIGATSAIFTVVHAVLLRPLPYRDPARLVMVWSTNAREQRPQNPVSPANFVDLRDGTADLAALEGFASFIASSQMRTDEGPERVLTSSVGTGLFDLLGRRALLGRTFAAGDTNVAVLGHGFWQRRFGGDASVIGRQLTIGDTVRTIVGVMPDDFVFPYQTMLGPDGFTRHAGVDLWMPWVPETDPFSNRNGVLVRNVHFLAIVGRLRPGVAPDALRARLGAVSSRLERDYPGSNAGWGTSVVALHEQAVGSVRPALLVLAAGVGVVLLMASVNVANLALARSAVRGRDLAVRAALGAGRLRLARQAVVESLLVSLAGALAALAVVRWGVRALLAMAPATLPRAGEIRPDLTVAAFTLAVGAAVGLVVGVVPALGATRADVREALGDSGRASVGPSASRRRLRAALVAGEVALAVLLAAGAGLLLRSFATLLSVDPGFRPEGLLTLQVELPARLTSGDARLAYYDELFERLRAIPGVAAAGGTTRLPLGSTSVSTTIDVEGRPRPDAELPEVQFRRAVDDYFGAMGIPLRRGRTFTRDDGPTAPRVCVINDAMAARLFPNDDPVGRRIRTGPTPAQSPWCTIVGVVGDLRHTGLDETPAPELYITHRQGPPVAPFLVLRTSADPAAMADLVRADLRRFDRALALYDIRTMTAVRAESVSERRFLLRLVVAFGVLAVMLAAIGVYGVTALVVGDCTREIGLRLALGAEPASVLSLVVGHAARLAGVGIAAGLALAWLAGPIVASQLFGVRPADPLTFASVAALLLATAIGAALVPARRALRIDPIDALRIE